MRGINNIVCYGIAFAGKDAPVAQSVENTESVQVSGLQALIILFLRKLKEVGYQDMRLIR